MLPSLVVIGAMKSGTSSLYHYLASHPAMTPASLKETDYFRSPDDFSQGLTWYENLFVGPGEVAYDVSPNYAKRHLFPGVPERMHSVLPDAKLVYLVRDPIERAVSHFVHSSASGAERRTFGEAIADPDSNYIQPSRYFFQVEEFLRFYPPERILIQTSEQLNQTPAEVVNQVCEFAGVPAEFDDEPFRQRFHESSQKLRATWVERVGRRTMTNPRTRARVHRVASPIVKAVRRRGAPLQRPQVGHDERETLHRALQPDAERLRSEFDIELEGWTV